MKAALLLSSLFVAFALVACGDDGRAGVDGGVTPGTDGGPVGHDAGAMFDGCTPSIEICGDRIDQNCDGRDTSCGDTDRDGIMACRAGDDLTMCDCDDSRADVRPPFGIGVPGAPEACDDVDNNCNGRVDEAAACCAGCASLGDHRDRADICTEDGTCDCSTEPGVGACDEGQTCCTSGCTDVATDFSNCGFCGARCTESADSCVSGDCACGAGPVCDLNIVCTGGGC
ncbi:MAG: hypothetical protein IPK60_22645 [Sandaracinaceae bacterium]|nr:hypothetical protein [Sandaracinaceae bacterium]